MAIHYRTQGIVFKKNDFGEADRFYSLFTKDFGRLEILAKAVRRMKAKLRSPLELFNLSEIEFIQGRKYKTLTDALVIESFPDIKKDLGKLKVAFEISIALDKLLKGEEKDENIWELLNETFKRLNKVAIRLQPVHHPSSLRLGPNWKLEIVYYYFFWNFLAFLGYKFEVQKCANCQKIISLPKIYFSFPEGGIICLACSRKNKERIEIDLNTLKLLRLIFQKDWSILMRLKISSQNLNNLKIISQQYLTFIENQL